MNAVISETVKAAILGLGMQVLEIPAQRKFRQCATPPLTPTKYRKLYCIVLSNTYKMAKKKFATPTLTPTNR